MTKRNPGWKDWYPSVIPDFSTFGFGESPYGEPNPETLDLFRKLPSNSDVTVLDIDLPHLKRLQTNAKAVLSNTAGKIDPVLADATENFPFHRQFDGVLNAGFGYLIPPDQLDPLFAHMGETLKPCGLLVFEFATNRARHDINGKSLIGKQEYIYTYEEGLHILKELYEKYGLKFMPPQTKTIHFETPYYLHNDLIIAYGIKN